MSLDDLAVWQYWEGPLPAYLEMCMETVRRHHPDVRVLDRQAFEALCADGAGIDLDAIDPPAVRADVVRAVLLHRYGGLWLDSDFVVLRTLHELAELPVGATFAAYRVDGGDFTNNLMYARPGDPVIADCWRNIHDHLRAGFPVTWLELGSDALKPAIQAHPESVHEIDADLVCPIPWHEMARFEQPGDGSALDDGRRLGIMLSNASGTDGLRRLSRSELLDGDSMLGSLLRHALPR